MRRCSSLLIRAIFGCLMLASTGTVHAQSDAEIALRNARAAFVNEDYSGAVKEAQRAAQTDENNPDVFLLLGRAHLQQGQIIEAAKAFRRVLELAPDHEYARSMVDALEGRSAGADQRLRLISQLIDAGLPEAAAKELEALSRFPALTPEQQTRLYKSWSAALLEINLPQEALNRIQQLTSLQPEEADSASVRLLTARAYVGIGGQYVTAGVALLHAIREQFPDSPEADLAQLEILAHRLQLGEDVVADVSAWMEQHGNRADRRRARLVLHSAVDRFLAASSSHAFATSASTLNAADRAALSAAGILLSETADSEVQLRLVQRLANHFRERYLDAGALAASREGLASLSDLPLAVDAKTLLNRSLSAIDEAAATHAFRVIERGLASGSHGSEEVKAWIAEHAGHPMRRDALQLLVTSLLAESQHATQPRSETPLADTDRAAIAAAEQLIGEPDSEKHAVQVIQVLATHFRTWYFDHGASEAAITGMTLLVPLEAPGRQIELWHQILDLQIQAAVADVKRAVAAGEVPPSADQLPESVAAAVAVAQRINRDFPSRPAWSDLADLSGQILAAGKSVPWPTRITAPKAAHSWALELAILVLAGEPDQASEESALALVDQVVNELAAITQTQGAGLARTTYTGVFAAVPRSRQIWPRVALRHVDLLMADSAREFDENIQTGRRDQNAALTDQQKQIITLLNELVAHRPAMAPVAMTRLSGHLTRWESAHLSDVVTTAWTTFAENVPPATRSRIELAIAWHRYNRLMEHHDRLLQSGFSIPAELEDDAKVILEDTYRLASILGPDDPVLKDVSQLRQQLIQHYVNLDLEEVAAAAIAVRVAPGDSDLDEAAELQLADLRRVMAERELDRLAKRYDGREQIAVTPAMRIAIAAYRQFITDHPTSRRVDTAVQSLIAVGQKYEQLKAWTIAAGLYQETEQFAKATEFLNQVTPNAPTVAERAAAARAVALHRRASDALTEWSAGRQADSPVPVQMSEEFQAAVEAWEAIAQNYQQRPVARQALAQMMNIAGEYAAVDAWDVAEQQFVRIQQLQLPLRSPERLEFGRAVCQMGKLLPDHARSVLSALALAEDARTDADKARVPSLSHSTSTIVADNTAGMALESEESAGARHDVGFAISGGMALGMNQPGAASAESAPASGIGGYALRGMAAAGAEVDAVRALGDSDLAEQSDRPGQFRREADAQLMAAVRSQLDRQAQQVARLRDEVTWYSRQQSPGQQSQQLEAVDESTEQQRVSLRATIALLSDAELKRQQQVADVVYAALQAIRNQYPESKSAARAREEIMVLINHWREIAQWDRAAKLATQFLADNPRDSQLPQIRQAVARDWLAWAAMGVKDADFGREELLSELASRFETARQELRAILVEFPDNTDIRLQAQWDIAVSFLTQARVVTASSPTLARGQYVRAARELLQVATMYHDHPQIGQIPDMLWSISEELTSRGYHDEAITVWNEIQIHYPALPQADRSALRIAQTWQQLGQPLRAVEAYLELNFARGGNEEELQNTIYQIAASLKQQKRWIEALHVLQTFVDSFPAHTNAGQSLTMIGQIHQENEVWEDAIKAYSRVIDEFPSGTWTTEARWSIAECTINLSLWQEAAGAYAEFQQSYPEDSRVAEAARRIEVLKTLQRFQDVIDEEGQRKAFDAQHQVAAIVHKQLNNPVKAIIEYRKVALNWPQSHLADDALFEIGRIYLDLQNTEQAREAFLQSAERYPESPLADDALLLVGTSYVNEADRLAAVDRGASQARAKDIAQKRAYIAAQDNRRRQLEKNFDQIAALKREGRREEAESKEAYFAGQALQFDSANTLNASNWAAQQEEVISAAQLADRQDKINAALRRAVASFRRAASVTAADKADDALLQMAQIYDERLKDSAAAMSTWEEIVRQYSGTAVAEDASWKMARYYETRKDHDKAIAAYQAFFRNYRRSPRAGAAQAAIAENHEHLGEWVQAMDAYANYVNNFPDGPLLQKAREQINWIKTYRL